MTVLCQWCGAANPDDREMCLRCSSKLLVVSGGEPDQTAEILLDEDAAFEQASNAFDEHLLERVSASEDSLRRMHAAFASLDDRVGELERSVALLDAGVQALIDLLDRRKVLRENEVMAAWERAASSELAREELLDKLGERRDGIVSRARTHGTAAAAACSRALQSAELALLAGQSVRAAEILDEALRRAQRNPELAGLLGELAFERSDLPAAEGYFRQVAAWDPGNVEARIYLGTILVDTGRAKEGRAELERAAELAPDAFLPHFALGAMHANGGDAAAAREHLRRAVQREQMPQAYFLLGVVELNAGHPGAAAQAFEAAVGQDPEFEDAIYHLGLAYLERHWHRKALECFRRVMEIDPQRLQYREAVRLVEAAGEGVGHLPAAARRLVEDASRAVEAGQIERALSRLQRALRHGEDPGVLASLALLAAAAGRHRQALAAAHRLLRLKAEGAPGLAAWTALLETLRATHRFRAVETLGQRLYREGRQPMEQAIAAYELALAEFERGGRGERALELAHAALELMPRELRQFPLAALGRIHLEREEYSDAVDYLEQTVALAATPAALTQLGLALLALGEGERAREVLQRSRHGDTTDEKANMLTHLARVGWLTGHGRWRG
ncbi:MAG: tetratricopeptide repeat protein [Acidobacteriota bacterium]